MLGLLIANLTVTSVLLILVGGFAVRLWVASIRTPKRPQISGEAVSQWAAAFLKAAAAQKANPGATVSDLKRDKPA